VIIINADDFGRSRSETDAALRCFAHGRVSSASAMTFMSDSERAAELGRSSGLDIGLHVNFSEVFTGPSVPARLLDQHSRIVRFLKRSRYALLVYHPGLRTHFRQVYQAQFDEFLRLYGRSPSHIDGHQHMHLCTNMLFDGIIPTGVKVRRSFTFEPGQKSLINRTYRTLVDRVIERRHRTTDFFFALKNCFRYRSLDRVFDLARTSTVEVAVHPVVSPEYAYLMSDECGEALARVGVQSYASL
jgi:predicted glycoside hydrolase/deacetylase ChbG (UPF0249 family)